MQNRTVPYYETRLLANAIDLIDAHSYVEQSGWDDDVADQVDTLTLGIPLEVCSLWQILGHPDMTQMQPFREASRVAVGPVDVATRSVIATQETLLAPALKHYLRYDQETLWKEDSRGFDPSQVWPLILQATSGQLYMLDGHHRMAAAWLMENPIFRATVVNTHGHPIVP